MPAPSATSAQSATSGILVQLARTPAASGHVCRTPNPRSRGRSALAYVPVAHTCTTFAPFSMAPHGTPSRLVRMLSSIVPYPPQRGHRQEYGHLGAALCDSRCRATGYSRAGSPGPSQHSASTPSTPAPYWMIRRARLAFSSRARSSRHINGTITCAPPMTPSTSPRSHCTTRTRLAGPSRPRARTRLHQRCRRAHSLLPREREPVVHIPPAEQHHDVPSVSSISIHDDEFNDCDHRRGSCKTSVATGKGLQDDNVTGGIRHPPPPGTSASRSLPPDQTGLCTPSTDPGAIYGAPWRPRTWPCCRST